DYTAAIGLNNLGQVVGMFHADIPLHTGLIHGFVWKDGVFSVIDVLGATETYVNGINDRGEIAGQWVTRSSTTTTEGSFNGTPTPSRSVATNFGGGRTAIPTVVRPDARSRGLLKMC